MKDTFIKNYHQAKPETSALVVESKSKADQLEAIWDNSGIKNREMSIAQTQFEGAMMWATKGYVNEGDRINSTKNGENAT